MRDLVWSAVLAVALVLVVAAASKARGMGVFREQIADYRLLPYWATGVVSVLVIALEAGTVPLLLLPQFRPIGALLALALFAIFLGAQSSAWRRGRSISCACFGGSALDVVGIHSLLRTFLLAGCAVAASLPAEGGVAPSDLLLAGLLVGLIFLVSEVARLITELRRKTQELVDSLEARVALNAEQGGT